MSETNNLGHKIRQLRESREMTLDQLAIQSHCHVDLLRRIEAGEQIPSLAPLMSIARALGMRLGTLLDDDPHEGALLIRGGQSQDVIRFSGQTAHGEGSNLVFHSLGAGKKDRHMEPFVIDVEPDNSQTPSLSSHEGEEFIYVLDGVIEINYGHSVYQLEAGDSLYYDSIVEHNVHAKGEQTARILAVVYAPI